MSVFPKDLQFKYHWRKYQQRILGQIKTHLSDKKLHVVAPPGSGKTVLGLEVALTLGKPVLILAPTLTIRNQWEERLVDDFTSDTMTIDWISKDIKNPKLVTISTYQALHIAIKNGTDIAQLLQANKVKTIVVDECHHLQKEWWKSLIHVVDTISPTVVALTATPPYDVNPAEWERYLNLCGPMDEEIGVPELVAEHNLCPHQDYIYFSFPSSEEYEEIFTFRQKAKEFMDYLRMNVFFKEKLQTHPLLIRPEENLDKIYDNPAYFSALLVLWQDLGGDIPQSTTALIGADHDEIPKINYEWLEIFLNEALSKDEYFIQYADEPDFKKIGHHLRKIGAIERGKIRLTSPEKIAKTLRTSNSKLDSVEEIVRLEYASLKENLRMVILTDFIRQEAMPKSDLDITDITQLGVVPLFELIRRKFPIEIEVGVLSGSVVIVPRYSEKLLDEILAKANLNTDDIVKKTLPHDDNYYLLEVKEKVKNKLVQIVTELFERGGIHVLVGTKSLLGEGWDAPAINTLVLATVVGSYVYSNQMRGRAIRTFKQDENKTANIWHLVCVEKDNPKGGQDIQVLKRRFRSFHGVSFAAQTTIENGMDRFLLPEFPIDENELAQLNKAMTIHAQNRKRLRDDWDSALERGVDMVEEIKIPFAKSRRYRRMQKQLTNRTQLLLNKDSRRFSYILLTAFMGGVLSISLAFSTIELTSFLSSIPVILLILVALNFRKVPKYLSLKNVVKTFKPRIGYLFQSGLFFLLTVLTATLVYNFLNSTALVLFVLTTATILSLGIAFFHSLKVVDAWQVLENHKDTEVFLRKAAIAILKTLQDMSDIKTPLNDLNLTIEVDKKGKLTSTLKGSTAIEERLFMEALQELVDPIDNARYILAVEKDTVSDFEETNYYAVPSSIGRNKKEVLRFQKHWEALLGEVKIIFTRNVDGRYTLLKARGQSMVENSHPKAERVSVWR